MAKKGSNSLVILLLLIATLVISAWLYWSNVQTNLQQQEMLSAKQRQHSAHIQLQLEKQIVNWQEKLSQMAKSQIVIEAFQNEPPNLTANQQQSLRDSFPEAQQICLISASVDKPDPTACVEISFAELSSIREAKQKGSSTVALMKLDSPNPYVLMTQAVTTNQGETLGILMLTLAKDVLKPLISGVSEQRLYFELRQGKTNSAKVFATGNPQLSQNGTASFIADINHTHWQIKSWTALPSTAIPVQLYITGGISLLLLILFIKQLMPQTDRKKATRGSKQPHPLSGSHQKELTASQQQSSTKKPISTPAVTASQSEQTPTNPEDTAAKRVEEKIQQVTELSPTIFRAYDIRGVVGKTLSVQIVKTLGQAIGSLALDKNVSQIIVGRDGRLSSESLAMGLIDGILSTGCDVIDIGEVPTPLVYFASRHLGTNSGVMLTASHNPADHNGLKIHINGQTVSGADLQKLYQRIIEGNIASGSGTKTTLDVVDDYIAQVRQDITLAKPLSIVLDGGNGVAGPVAEKLFTALGCEVSELYCDVDGHFPNHHPNPSEPANLQDLITTIKSQGADLGLAYDGDGDRLGVVDAKGQIIWPDRLMMLFAQDVLSLAPGSTVIYDVKSTRLLEDVIQAADGQALMSKSGYSNIRGKMEESSAVLAGEMTGHIIFNDRWFGVDDALYSACRLLELLASDPLERTSTEVFEALPNLQNTPEIFIDLAEGESQRFMRQLEAEAKFTGAKVINLDGLRVEYPSGWGLVRASNTVSGLTLRFEADTLDNLHHIQQQFKQQMLQVKPTLALHF